MERWRIALGLSLALILLGVLSFMTALFAYKIRVDTPTQWGYEYNRAIKSEEQLYEVVKISCFIGEVEGEAKGNVWCNERVTKTNLKAK